MDQVRIERALKACSTCEDVTFFFFVEQKANVAANMSANSVHLELSQISGQSRMTSRSSCKQKLDNTSSIVSLSKPQPYKAMKVFVSQWKDKGKLGLMDRVHKRTDMVMRGWTCRSTDRQP